MFFSVWTTPPPTPPTSPTLLHQPHIADDHPPVNGLAHVVDGQQPDLHGRQRFHFHAGLPVRLGAHRAADGPIRLIQFEVDRDLGQRQRVTQRDQIRRPLRPLDRGDAGDAQHIAFLGGAVAHQRECRGQHVDEAGGDGDAVGDGFVADVDHVGLSGGIEVGEVRHG